MRKIKLLWEFRGIDAEQLATHHAKHLNEFIESEEYELQLVGYENYSNIYVAAYLVVYEKDVLDFRDKLKPQKAVVYQSK